ncbi:alpha/beta hydrolase fold domain-containing protein [Antrihabitans sp. YC3-6]|uniref:Alpha/beta hydrolase fold domain-containing protein n=1 Tax=Antrihabitans stalagmiti TaxID=2799499 RepID=A0A934NUX2_9NOCA|nr:alpha/beta hydrolase fold domain-containing protein [Antrihabitans stalagmiti]MBJ8342009.1 alpha/beta hydrolase fold domain-containing protein [Antrihabitans stalagmiti]
MTAPHATVHVELVNSARRSTRIAHRIARSTLRPAADTIAKIGAHGPFAGAPAFRVANVAEVLAAPLRAPRGTLREQVQFANFRAEWLWHNSIDGPSKPTGGAIVYLHGGAFVAGGLHSHRRLAAKIASASALPLLNVDYRQLPKGHITDSVDDAVQAYRYLLDQGFAPEKIILAGDSAGGGLAFAAALAIRDRGLATPAAIVAIAPFADFDSTRRAAHPNDSIDPVMSAFLLSVPVLQGFATDGIVDPAWSPVNHDFTGLPPVLIQVGSTEVLRDDAEQLARRCAEAGVPCTLQVWDHAIHDFHVAADVLPDARAAIAEIGKFVHSITEGKQVGQ